MKCNKSMGNRGSMNFFLKVVLSLLGLFLFGMLIVKVYDVTVGGDYHLAQKTRDVLEAKIRMLELGKAQTLAVRGPASWVVRGWSGDAAGRIDKCALKSCLCICPDTTIESCQGSRGICFDVDVKKVRVYNVPLFDSLKSEEGQMFVAYPQKLSLIECIRFPLHYAQFEFVKNTSTLEVRDYAPEVNCFR